MNCATKLLEGSPESAVGCSEPPFSAFKHTLTLATIKGHNAAPINSSANLVVEFLDTFYFGELVSALGCTRFTCDLMESLPPLANWVSSFAHLCKGN